MVRQAKWTLWLVLCLALFLLCMACMGGNDGDVVDDNPLGDDIGGITGENTDNPVSVVRLGFIGPITGSDAAMGSAARNAFMMAIDQANASGEFPYVIEVLPIDDQGTASIAVTGTQRVISDPLILGVCGFWNSAAAEAAIPEFIESETPLIIWGAAAHELTNAGNLPWVTRCAPSDTQESAFLAEFVLDELGYEDWFLVSDMSFYGLSTLESFQAELTARDLEPLGHAQVPEDNTDFSLIVQQIEASNAKAVFCGSNYHLAAFLKKQLSEAGVEDILFCVTSAVQCNDYLSVAEEAAEGTLVVTPGLNLTENPTGQKFLEDYTANDYMEPLNSYTPYAYEAALILLGALRACGPEPTPELLSQAILESETFGIMGTTAFDENGQTTNEVFSLQVVQDGGWVYYEDSSYAHGRSSFGGQPQAIPDDESTAE